MRETFVREEDKLINRRRSRIEDANEKLDELEKKLSLIKARKFDEAGIKQSNAYFEMVRVEKQIQLLRQKIDKSNNEIQKF